ncbi:hypothetical protein PInf_012481 [Phytophthora infestans]|nr:hypothetical protein PInf_012481 [Phytophthora infestans]
MALIRTVVKKTRSDADRPVDALARDLVNVRTIVEITGVEEIAMKTVDTVIADLEITDGRCAGRKKQRSAATDALHLMDTMIMASEHSSAVVSLPGLIPTTMSPTGTASETVTGQEDAAVKKTEALSNSKPREPKLLLL